jgi:hypothetical protein
VKLAKGVAVIALAMPAFGQYAGPAILSRGESPAGLTAPQLSFRPFLEITGVYNTGLSGVAVVNAQGDLANTTAEGIEFTGGISGMHRWKHTSIGLDYRGSVRHYNKATFYDGTEQSLMLGITHQFTRHVLLTLRETAGVFSWGAGLLGLPQSIGYDPNSPAIPTADFYDNQTIYLMTDAALTFQKSARLSFNFGGNGDLVRRRSSALYGVTGAMAHGDFQYRLTRRTTVGAMYLFTHYDFIGILGGTYMHSAVLTYSTALSKNWEFSGYAGVARLENQFEQLIPLAPPIQALLGVSAVPAVVYNRSYIPNVEMRLTRTFANGVAYITGSRMVTPGNGLFLTSMSTNAIAGYNFTGLRRWSFGASGGYMAMQSLGNVVGRYNTAMGGFTASRQITRALHAIASFGATKYSSPTFTNYNRPVYYARIGLGFTPGDVPLRIW